MKNKITLLYVVISFVAIGLLCSNSIESKKTIERLEEKIDEISYVETVSLQTSSYNNIETTISNTETNKVEEVKVIKETTKVNNSANQKITKTVYLTNTGAKYHAAGCRYLKKSCTEVSLEQALSMGKTPCSVCRP